MTEQLSMNALHDFKLTDAEKKEFVLALARPPVLTPRHIKRVVEAQCEYHNLDEKNPAHRRIIRVKYQSCIPKFDASTKTYKFTFKKWQELYNLINAMSIAFSHHGIAIGEIETYTELIQEALKHALSSFQDSMLDDKNPTYNFRHAGQVLNNLLKTHLEYIESATVHRNLHADDLRSEADSGGASASENDRERAEQKRAMGAIRNFLEKSGN